MEDKLNSSSSGLTGPKLKPTSAEASGPDYKGPRALSLVYYDDNEGFKVSDEAVEFLSSIKEKVGVIVVAGKYRTGKSFLLNRIIMNKIGEGFGVGPTINPWTKGLWVWNEVFEAENEEKFKVIIVDSEGIGAFDEDQNHDTKIFLFALLLSSYFIYNSMGTIDETAINNLSLIINLSKNLHIQAENTEEEDPDELAKYFPKFLWVLRDFTLQLKDTYDNPINPKDYLENALSMQKSISEKIESRNRIRRLIKHYFNDRDCFTLVRPTEEEVNLQGLQLLPDSELRPEFVDAARRLRNKIFRRVKPKLLNGKFITGEMLLELCHSYTRAVNKGSVPSIKSAWSYVCLNECQRAIDTAIQAYESKLSEFMKSAKESQDIAVLESGEKSIYEEIFILFKTKAVGSDTQAFESSLRVEINKKYKEYKKQFNIYWEAIMEKKYGDIINEIKRGASPQFYTNSPNKDNQSSKSGFREQLASFK